MILNRRHLERVLRVYVDHYNTQRPHRALKLQPPELQKLQKLGLTPTIGEIRRLTASSTSTTEPPPETRHE